MPKTLKDFWILFRLPKGAFLCSVMLFLSGLIAGYFYANWRYEEQAYGVDSEYVYNYLHKQNVSISLVDEKNPLFVVETGMGDTMILVRPGYVQLFRLYEYEFAPGSEITRLHLLNAINSAKLGGTGIMALFSFDGTKAVVQVSYQSHWTVLSFQQNWRALFKTLDFNDRILDAKLEALVGKENVWRNLVQFSDYGRIFNAIQDAKNYAPSAIQGMIDLMSP